jgi:hypothetical protein
MNLTTNTFNKPAMNMGYPMLAAVCTWCFSMFKQVRISIKHRKRVVF